MSKDDSGDNGSKPVDASTARRRQDALGRRLRQMYDNVVREAVPDDFLSFLEQADQKSEGKPAGAGEEAETEPPRRS